MFKTIKELEKDMRFPNIETEAVLTQTRDVLKLIRRILNKYGHVISLHKIEEKIQGK